MSGEEIVLFVVVEDNWLIAKSRNLGKICSFGSQQENEMATGYIPKKCLKPNCMIRSNLLNKYSMLAFQNNFTKKTEQRL